MIWATVSPWSCFCWLYTASLCLAAKNIINLISVLTIWWCPCVESPVVLLEGGVYYDQCVLLAKHYLPLHCFILYSEAKFACYSRCFLTSYFCKKWYRWSHLRNRNGDTDTENTPRRKGVGVGGMNGEVGTDLDTLLCIKQIMNENLRNSTGSATQCSVLI